MKHLKVLAVLILSPILLTGCGDIFEKKGNIEDYAGEYVLETANERTYHVYWNSKTLTNEKSLMETGAKITITEDKKVVYVDKEGNESKGKIKCLEKYCRFYSTPLSSSYKFYLRYDGALYYSYESTHMSVEYDVTYRSIILTRVQD